MPYESQHPTIKPGYHIRLLKGNLEGYSSRDIAKELIQNADDAGATYIKFIIFEGNNCIDKHTLIDRPALAVLNDGAFKQEDFEAIPNIIGGTKDSDSAQIGRFGLGLKSVYNICELFYHLGSDGETLRGALLNPWYYKDSEEPYATYIKEETRELGLERLQAFYKKCNLENRGFLLWLPLSDGSQEMYFTRRKITVDELYQEVFADIPFELYLTQCANLKSIFLCKGDNLESSVEEIFEYEKNSHGILWRTSENHALEHGKFPGTITLSSVDSNKNKKWFYYTIQSYQRKHEDLDNINMSTDWPKDISGEMDIRLKAQNHAAITIIRESDVLHLERIGAPFVWASFMPITEENYLSESWNLILHGYFLVTSDRKKLPGIFADDESIKAKWNTCLTNVLLMPLFPEFLSNLEDNGLVGSIIGAIQNNITPYNGTTFYKKFQNAITSKNVYAKILDSKGVSWRCMPREEFDSKEKHKLSLHESLEEGFIKKLKENKEEALYILSAEDESLLPNECSFKEIPESTIRVILNQFLETIHKAEGLSSYIGWLENFWRKTSKYYNPWGEFIIQLIGTDSFLTSNDFISVVAIVEKYYPQSKIRYCEKKYRPTIEALAKENLLSVELIYFPNGISNPHSLTFNKAELVEKLFAYLIDKQITTNSDKNFINLLRQDLKKAGVNPRKNFYASECILTNESLISYEFVDSLIKDFRIFKRPIISQREKWINTYLVSCLGQKVYLLDKEDGTLENIPEITEQSIAQSILANDINKDTGKKDLVKILYNDGKGVSPEIKNAIRKLISCKDVVSYKLILFSSDNKFNFLKDIESLLEDKTYFIPRDKHGYLGDYDLKKFLEIKDIEENINGALSDIIEVLLSSASPWENATHINTCLKKLQSITTLEKNLSEIPWIPDGKGKGISLGKTFIKSSYSEKLSQLDFVKKTEWITLSNEEVDKYIPPQHRDKLLNKSKQIERFKADCEEFFKKENSTTYALFPSSFPISDELVTTILESSSFAWDSIKLLQIVKKYELGLVDFANLLPKNVTQERQNEILTHFSDIKKLKQKNIRDFYETYLTSCVRENINIFSENPDLLLPTQSDNKYEQWKECREILLSGRDDGNSYQLLEKRLRGEWKKNGIIIALENKYRHANNNEEFKENQKVSYEFLKKYFSNYTGENPRISLFLFLVYSNNDVPTKIQDLAKELFPNEKWSGELDKLDFSPNIPITIKAQPPSKETQGVSFSGDTTEIKKIAGKNKSLFSIPPAYITPISGTSYWEIYFDTDCDGINAPIMTNEEFEIALFETIKDWLKEYKDKSKNQEETIGKIDKQLDTWWNDSSQTQISVESTREVLKTELPYILKVLKPQKSLTLGKLLNEYNEKLLKKEPVDNELNKIWNEAKIDEAVGNALRNKISENGYRTSSVLFELLQNADDAIQQASELNKFKQEVHSEETNYVKIQYKNNGHQLIFLHNGRPINEGGDCNLEWKSDLSNMVNFNVSYKSPQNDSSSITGMFGLGFKSVHLISEEPEIYSGNLYFIIKNTLFPESKARTENKDSSFSTQFILPLKNEIKVEDVFSKLNDVYKIIPVTSRGIKKLEVESDSDRIETYSVEYEPKSLLSCADEKSCWRVCYNCNVLVFETTVNCGGKEQLFSLIFNIEVRNEQLRIIDFSKTPFLWNTMPTQEEWECKYVFNGFFKLNPGRTHIDIQDSDTLDYVKLVGESLGKGLCELYEIKKGDWNEQVWADLWNILSVGIVSNGEKTDRQNFLRALHCDGKGLSYWTQAQKLAASGLEKPFSPLATLGNEVFIDEFYLKDGIKKVIKENKVSTSNFINFSKARILEVLGHEDKNIHLNKEVDFYDTILSLICKKNLSVDVFHSLLPALDEWPESRSKKDLLVKTQTGDYKEIQQVLMTRPKFHINVIEYEEEFLRAEFAPPENILHEDYLRETTQIKFFIRLRWRHIIDSKLLMLWALKAKEENKENVLYYIEHGELGTAIVDKLEQADDKSSWIFNPKAVEAIAQGRFNRALLLLFPPKYDSTSSTEMLEEKPCGPSTETIKSAIDIKKIESRVGDERIRDKCWPDSFTDELLLSNLEDNDTKTWCTLLLLGCMQSMGRQGGKQHKGFINKLISGEIPNLWDKFTVLKGNRDKIEWIESLDAWFDTQTHSQEYSEWMSLFSSMYQINKYITVYIKLFTDLPTIATKNGELNLEENFSIRVNPEYSFGGKRCDAPPLPLKIGKYWVIRELSRIDFEGYRKNESILQYCWIPKTHVMEKFNVQYESKDENHIRHQSLIRKLKEINNDRIPDFNHNFDLALKP